ncbi:Crp/Fnr family transcriptional regulator [Longitalea luteola]|uniref:Crp/Fnr family transcriptional regulator n=1 Tax=Longitalea luteola TaxID=2812563 RepID=UPI001A97C8B1|nr:Crp/Fnr family transcriptional regulator [Longitalea luteola]
MTLDQIIERTYQLPASSRAQLAMYVTEVSYPKCHVLLRADRVESYMYFIKKGIARAYTRFDDNEITFWFGKEGDMLVSLKSFVDDQKGYETIELLEDCELYVIGISNLRALFTEDIHIANWGRKLVEQELIKTEERLISRLFQTASERYKDLLQHNHDLLKRVQLGYIASYLGITQVSLSRIRAEIK